MRSQAVSTWETFSRTVIAVLPEKMAKAYNSKPIHQFIDRRDQRE
jgi:predicted phosphoadenosine phosphosulfate sulfurtransferase